MLAISGCPHPPASCDAGDPRGLAEELAIHSQSVPSEISTRDYGDAWLPPRVRALGGVSTTISPDGAQVVTGTRDHPVVCSLVREGAGAWRLERNEEDGSRTIARVRIEPTAHVAMTKVVGRAKAEYARRLAAAPNDLRMHQQRLAFMLEFSRREAARRAAVDSIARSPDHWWPRFAAALVDGSPDAAVEFRRWVGERPTFSRMTYLAHLERLTGRTGEACTIMAGALTLPIREERDDILNSSARAYGIAAACFDVGRRRDALAIAEAMMEREPDRYTRERFALPFRSIRVAALFRLGDVSPARSVVERDGLVERDPFYRDPASTLPALGRAIASGDADFVRAWRPEKAVDFEEQVLPGIDVAALRRP